MTTYSAYLLHFTSPLHIGNYKPDSYDQTESFLRSDTIIAAVMSSWAKMGKKEYIGDGTTTFTVSSCFPFYGKKGEKYNFFFPRLKLSFNLKDRDAKLSKKLKKVTWLDQLFFEKQLRHAGITENLEESIQGEYMSVQKLPDSPFMYKQVSERVTVPRDQKDATPFHMERIYFNNGGLYFIAQGDGQENLETALNFLQFEGFGTDRSVGNGFFTWSKEQIHLEEPVSYYSTNLGLYCPEVNILKTEVDDHASFELIKRGGWITSEGYQTLEKNSIYMFTEGSVFKRNARVGGIDGIVLTPKESPLKLDHEIFRSGKTIFIPVKV